MSVTIDPYESDEKGRPAEVARITTGAGRPIYLMPVEAFPGHINNIYFTQSTDERWMMFDAGTALSEASFARGFAQLREKFGVDVGFDDVDTLVISHAHIDHFGGVHRFADRKAEVIIHELDARVLEHYEERVVVASRAVEQYIEGAGVSEHVRQRIVERYTASKDWVADYPELTKIRDGDHVFDDFRAVHVPGHCPGMIALIVDDVMLTADHVLSRITPNQAPQSITAFTGLEHYFRSLEDVWDIEGIKLGLGGHEAPIEHLRRRIYETVMHHQKRLNQCLEICSEPDALERGFTIAEVSKRLFGEQHGVSVFLALTEAGAHIEYLHQLGHLTLANLEDVAKDRVPVMRFRTREPGMELDLVAEARKRRGDA